MEWADFTPKTPLRRQNLNRRLPFKVLRRYPTVTQSSLKRYPSSIAMSQFSGESSRTEQENCHSEKDLILDESQVTQKG